MEAEGTEAELSRAGCNSLCCGGTAVSLLVGALTRVTYSGSRLPR